MPRAQCYYEILGVEETATGDEIKRAYRNLALVWHPDKNQANPEEAHAKFQVILKAYETLSDSREREWYDRHKDQILSDGDKNNVEECINLFQYFSSSCYANFDDSEDGFYTMYRSVFDELAKEEEKATEQAARYAKSKSKSDNSNYKSINSYPSFGNSTSDYEEIVRPFYAFWSGFCTNLTFDHLDKYNTLEAENRRILRAMDKENKKVKDAARKERNTNVRKLVEFIKKRDKRLKAHKILVEQQNELNRQKTAEKQRQQREKSMKESSQYKPASWQDMDDFEEQLRQLESEYDLEKPRKGRAKAKYEESDEDDIVEDPPDELDVHEPENTTSNGADQPGEDGLENEDADSEEEEEEEEEEAFFCPACNKDFRTINAFENHENSKKHKQNVIKLTKLLKEEEKKLTIK